MPAIDFPASPTLNQEYSFEGRTWRWNATGWEVKEYPAALLAGTAANPSLYFSGDPNTGIYSPGADQVAVATNGVGRLVINATGDAILGATDAKAQLHVYGTGQGTANLTDAGARGALLRLSDTESTAGAGGGIIFSNGQGETANSVGFAAIKGLLTNGASNTEGDLAFATRANVTAVALQERLRITSAGLVGIGTSAPSYKLDVRGGNAAVINTGTDSILYIGEGLGTSEYMEVGWTASTNVGRLTTTGTGALSFDTNLTPRLFIKNTGEVGIGTTSPGAVLHTVAADNAYSLLAAGATGMVRVLGYSSGSGPGGFIDSANAAQSAYLPLTINGTDVRLASGAIERARIDSSGRLLVGTSSALSSTAKLLEVAQPICISTYVANAFSYGLDFVKSRGTTNGTIVQNGDQIGQIKFFGDDGTSTNIMAARIEAAVDGTPGANDMPGRLVFSTTADGAASPTERFRITSAGVLQIADAGNITVGTTTGTKIGTATTQKLGFYNATPVVQPAAVANATDAASVITQLNDLLAKLRTLGIIAT